MPTPRTFIEKKTVPGLGVPTSVDRNTRLALENIIENLRDMLKRVVSLEGGAVTQAQLAQSEQQTGSGGDIEELIDGGVAPLDAPDTYLRFERDVDGDVQQIILGTVS